MTLQIIFRITRLNLTPKETQLWEIPPQACCFASEFVTKLISAAENNTQVVPTVLVQPPLLVTSRPRAKLKSGNGHKQKDGKQSKTKSQAGVPSLSRKFIIEDPIQYFIQNWEATWVAWASLGQLMALPPRIPVMELDLESRVVALHRVVSGKDANLPPRFGHVQLVLFLDALERRIRQDRLNNLIVAKHRRRYETQAIDMFLSSLDRALNTRTPRSRIWTLKRFGEKWNDIVGSWVLLLLIFSRTAESSV